jgi:hypothetical protein
MASSVAYQKAKLGGSDNKIVQMRLWLSLGNDWPDDTVQAPEFLIQLA